MGRSSARALAAIAFVCAFASTACGETMTKEQCTDVADHMLAVWESETEATAPERGPRSERAVLAIKGEGERLRTEWLALCERELQGRKIDEKEIDCVMRAKTIAAIQECGLSKK